MEELVYAGNDVETLILEKWPNAEITDTSDDIHKERFSLLIPDILEEDFYIFAIQNEFANLCLNLNLSVGDNAPDHLEKRELVEIWMQRAAEEE